MRRRGDVGFALKAVVTAVIALGIVFVAFKALEAMDILNMCNVISNQLGQGTHQVIAELMFNCPG